MEKSGGGRMMDGLMNGIDRDTEISVERRGIEIRSFLLIQNTSKRSSRRRVQFLVRLGNFTGNVPPGFSA